MYNFSKTNASILQLGLARSGYYNGAVDGIIGERTTDAIERFLKDNNLEQNENQDVFLMDLLERLLTYLAGYVVKSVALGDTFYSLAEKYNTTVRQIEIANPNVNPNNLKMGEKLVVPITESSTITNLNYNSFLVRAVELGISKRYPFCELIPIGRSVWGKMIYLLKMGEGDKEIFFNGEHHANEWITTPIVLKYFEKCAEALANGEAIGKRSAEEIFKKVKLCVVAAVNPDGLDIVNESITESRKAEIKKLSDNYPSIKYPQGWKANANGVDLNLNYPAGWEKARDIKYEAGYTMPGPRDFVGAAPLDQPESICIYNLTVLSKFLLTISYHTQGAVIYWKYLDFMPEYSKEIGERLAAASGYELEITPATSGYAGYKDWFIQTYNRPGYTIEAGVGENPLPISDFDRIYKENEPLMTEAIESVIELL